MTGCARRLIGFAALLGLVLTSCSGGTEKTGCLIWDDGGVTYRTVVVGERWTEIHGANDRGAIVGEYGNDLEGESAWFYIDADGERFNTGTDASPGTARVINRAGDIAGQGSLFEQPPTGFIRWSTGEIESFQLAEPNEFPKIYSLADNGQVAGRRTGDGGATDIGFIYTADEAVRDFRFEGTVDTTVVATNEAGWIAGWGILPSSSVQRHSFVQDPDGAMTIVARLSTDSRITDMNRAGDVIGNFSDRNFDRFGFVRPASGDFIQFQVGNSDTRPVAVNDEGDIVGLYTLADESRAAFYRSAEGEIVTFELPDGHGLWLTDVTNTGTIVGFSNSRFVADQPGTGIVIETGQPCTPAS